MWTRFMDMHSGGGCKEPPYEYIYIEAPQREAEVIFYNRFGHNPNRVTCTCCGEDYSVSEEPTLQHATGYDRGCQSGYELEDGEVLTDEDWYKCSIEERVELNKHFKYFERPRSGFSFHRYCTLEDYLKRENVLVIYAKDIKDHERVGSVPEQGYVWVD